MDGVEAQNVENYVAGTGRTFRIPAPGHRRPHDIIAGGDVITGGPRPVPGLSNGHGYDVMNCIIVMTSCEYHKGVRTPFQDGGGGPPIFRI